VGQQSARNPFHLVSNENMLSFLDHDFNLVSPLKDRLAQAQRLYTSTLSPWFAPRFCGAGSAYGITDERVDEQTAISVPRADGRSIRSIRRTPTKERSLLPSKTYALCVVRLVRHAGAPGHRPKGMSRPLNSSPPRTVNEVMTLPAASEKVSRGRTAIFTSFLHHRDYLGPHGTPLAAD